jgi:hypothetical protein
LEEFRIKYMYENPYVVIVCIIGPRKLELERFCMIWLIRGELGRV